MVSLFSSSSSTLGFCFPVFLAVMGQYLLPRYTRRQERRQWRAARRGRQDVRVAGGPSAPFAQKEHRKRIGKRAAVPGRAPHPDRAPVGVAEPAGALALGLGGLAPAGAGWSVRHGLAA